MKGFSKNMLGAEEQRREVARLLAEVREEHENIKEIFTSLGDDPCKYHFIVQNLDIMYQIRRQLQELVGDATTAIIAKELGTCPDCKKEAKDEKIAVPSSGSRKDFDESGLPETKVYTPNSKGQSGNVPG